jgi:hypothetical protein
MQLNVTGSREMWPSTEKKIMKPAGLCITLLLPTLVDPRKPTFSLCRIKTYNYAIMDHIYPHVQNSTWSTN